MDAICAGCVQRDRRLAELEKLVAQLQAQCQRLTAQVERLTAQLQEAQRSGKRQAAPFSKGDPKAKPKKPGRKAGKKHGRHGHRQPPPPEQIDEVLEAPLPAACPDCGGPLEENDGVDEQTQEEITVQPKRRQFRIHTGRCRHCGRAVRGRHPLQTSDAVGAAASQIGPDAQAAVVYLNKHAGLSHGKVADVCTHLLGIRLSRGASAQIVLRAADKLRPAYQQIQESIQQSAYITPDETSWRIGGYSVWLHSWVGDQATCYVIDPQRSANALEQVIGLDYSGILIHDGWASYDRFQEAIHQQCVAHALRRAHELEQSQRGAAKVFPRQVIDLFQGALAVRDDYLASHLDKAELAAAHEHYVNELLDGTERPRTNAANATFARHLYNHAEQWFMFLIDPNLPATNYQAEQALRGPIVNRKVWGGNRTPAGGQAQAINCSVLQTCKQQGRNVLQFLSDTIRGAVTSIFSNSPQSEAVGR